MASSPSTSTDLSARRCEDCNGFPADVLLKTLSGVPFYVCQGCADDRRARDFNALQVAQCSVLTHIPDRYADATLADFDDGIRLPLEGFLNPEGEPVGLVTLMGKTGVGKTHAAYAVMRDTVMTRGIVSRFRSAPEFLLRLQRLAGENMADLEDEVIRLGNHTGPVIIDDLGAEKTTEFGRAAFYIIVSKREAAKMPTLVTTNLTLTEIAVRFDPRLADRLRGGTVLAMTGKSRRR